MTVTEDPYDDLFAPARDEGYGVRNGRYRFPAPPGHQDSPNGWMRTTNLASAFSDQERLMLWLTWKAMMGLRASDGLLFDEWMATPVEQADPQQQSWLANQLAEQAREVAGGKDAARRGTARHAMMEHYFTTGGRAGTRAMLLQLDQVIEVLDRLDYDVVPGSLETKLWHPIAGGVMGTRDARVMCRRTGRTGVLDWKTQANFWTWQEIAGQLYGYDSATHRWVPPFDDRGHWEEAEVNDLYGRPGTRLWDRRVAIVVHMPLGGPVCVKQVDLEYGREVLEVAARNVELRSVGRSKSAQRMPAEDLTPLLAVE